MTVACDQLAGRVGQAGGVESAGVDDQPDPVRDEVLERGVQVVEEAGRVALAGVLGARLAEDQHRHLGEVVTGEDVDAAGSSHVGHGRSAVTVEAGAVPDPDWTLPASRCRGHAVAPAVDTSPLVSSPPVLLTRTVPSNPTSPEGFSSISSRVRLSPSADVTRAV